MEISRDLQIPGVIRIAGGSPGPHAVMFAGLHGDEVSGVHALDKLLFDFVGGERKIRRGLLTLARGNAEALAAERRYLKLNMNRLFKDGYGPDADNTGYEFERAQVLKGIIRQCEFFLDFHSAPIAQDAFLVAEEKSVAFFSRLGLPRIISGWSKFSGGPTGGDAETYARNHGALAATLESGSHFNKSSNDVAYSTALAFLSLTDMLDEKVMHDPVEPEIIEMYRVVTKEAADFRYAPPVKNFKFLREGESFAFENGAPLTVDQDSYLLIPMEPQETKLHEEVCYLGKKVRT